MGGENFGTQKCILKSQNNARILQKVANSGLMTVLYGPKRVLVLVKEIFGGVKRGVVFLARKGFKVDFFEIPQQKKSFFSILFVSNFAFCIVFVSNFPPDIKEIMNVKRPRFKT